jgi:hypothetical protein
VLVAVVAAIVASWRALEKAGFEVTSFSPGISVGSGGVASPLELHRMEAVLGEPSVVGLTNGHASLPDIGSAGRAARLSRYAGSAPCAPVFQFAGILEHIRDLGAC